MRILLADDEEPLLHFLSKGLRSEGHECTSISKLHEVLTYIRKHRPEVVVLDRMFGSEDSLTIIDSIKALPSPPMVLLLTALDEVSERVKGLRHGADDYLCKPFDFDELLARVSALQRRSMVPEAASVQRLRAGELTMILDERLVHLSGQPLELTKLEYELLLYLVESAGKVLSRERILSRVWQTHHDPQTNVVDVYISRLRRKLDSEPSLTIQTLRGNGYRFLCDA